MCGAKTKRFSVSFATCWMLTYGVVNITSTEYFLEARYAAFARAGTSSPKR